jgi:hypothetical protein
MELYSVINNTEYQNYFKEKSSKEHYRLLTYLSNQFDNQTFVDVGTLKGCSALALSHNKTNKVFSFNLSNQLELNSNLENVEFIIDNVINGKYDEVLLNSKFILLDTYHDGTFELEFLNYLKKLNYDGFLILDDIHLNKDMKLFWDNIEKDKLDITNIGHTTGTGVVFFNNI